MSIFIPAAGLLKQTGPNGLVLCLGTEDWFKLQSHIQAIQALPYDIGEYQSRYGDPTSGLPMQQAFEAMRFLKRAADRYGSARTLRARVVADPNVLSAPWQPRDDANLATAWTLQRAHEDAARIARTLANIPGLARNEPPDQVVAGIKSLFLDTDQILDRVLRTETALTGLIEELETIESALAEAQDRMRAYTSSSSKTMSFLSTEIGELEQTIKKLEKDRDAAWKKWVDLTIAAVAVPAGIAIIGVAVMVVLVPAAGGGAFAIGTAVTTAAAGVAATALGVFATNARSAYDDLVRAVDDKSALVRKRIAYRHDLGALDAQMNFTLPATAGVIEQISVIRNAWKSLGSEIRYRVSDLGVESLRSGPWLQTEEMRKAADNWVRVDEAIRVFGVNSIVDAEPIQVGGALPQADPHWQEKILKKVAA